MLTAQSAADGRPSRVLSDLILKGLATAAQRSQLVVNLGQPVHDGENAAGVVCRQCWRTHPITAFQVFLYPRLRSDSDSGADRDVVGDPGLGPDQGRVPDV